MTVRLGLVGFGGVNRAFLDIIRAKASTLSAQGHDLRITAISDRTLGAATHPDGLDQDALANQKRVKGALAHFPNGSAEPNNALCASRDHVDVLVEAAHTNAVNGEPSLSLCKQAMANGVHVVTVNKGPIAFGYRDLIDLGRKTGARLGLEGTVMSGTPVVRWAQTCLPGDTLTGISGILNGTANFILGQIEAGGSFQDALKTAQDLGYAEADPTADVEGHDVQLKVAILAALLFDEPIAPKDIPTTGISGLTETDIRTAPSQGAHWKLVGSVQRTPTGITASVAPQKLTLDKPLSTIAGATNGLTLHTEHLGDVLMTGPGAGRVETGYALFADLLSILNVAATASPDTMKIETVG